ncbi:MAG: hypothetical protein Q8Q23_03490 [bacterium]|nr:hypothetical protein [bacterium]
MNDSAILEYGTEHQELCRIGGRIPRNDHCDQEICEICPANDICPHQILREESDDFIKLKTNGVSTINKIF